MNMSLAQARKRVDEKLADQRSAKASLSTLNENLDAEKLNLLEIEELQELFQTAVKLMYSNLSSKLGDVITEGLNNVFPESQYKFCVEFVERRNTVEADVYLQDSNGNKYHPLDAVGGGIADFISILFRITYIVLSPNKNVLIADEPLKFIDRGNVGHAVKFIKGVCKDLGVQMLFISHIPEMVECSDRVYSVTKKSGVSSVRKIKG